jgi:carboxypeptidase B
MVSPKIESKFLQFLKSNKIMHKMTITNVEEMLRKERQNRSKNMRKLSDDFNEESFKRYWTFDEMEQFADYLVSNHGSIVKKDLLGTTFEGRNIFGLKISNNLSAFGEKPIIFIDAGTHARSVLKFD